MMSRYHSYISSATKIVEAYEGSEPFVHYLRKYFAAQKKFGSRDRKTIAALCYSYFRTVQAIKNGATADKILKGFFLCETEPGPLLATLAPHWNEMVMAALPEKLALAGIQSEDIFPLWNELGDSINKEAFALSLLVQPLLFIRTRPGKKEKLINALAAASIVYDEVEPGCFAIQNATSLETLVKLNRDVVVQDYNSQKVFDFLDGNSFPGPGKVISAWDCCAASGGKSILLFDRLKGAVQLTVSDIRPPIIANLVKRLQDARVPLHRTFIADLSSSPVVSSTELFDIIVCDAPCTGSGTWSRTPEQHVFFKPGSIGTYTILQRKISANALSKLKPGGLFFYITCSVFKKENEEVVAYLQQEFAMTVAHTTYLKGYDKRADTMFVAVLTK